MPRPYEKTATRQHPCRMAELDLAASGCTGTISVGDPVVPFEDGVAHYGCVAIDFYAQYVARGAHPGPDGGV